MTQIGAVNREVSDRTFATSPDDLWEAITKPERLARWFGCVSGDLRLGGSFQITGNAKGEVTACKPPEMLAVTWRMYGDESWVQAHLSSAPNGGTLLKVEHILSRRLFDRLYWSWYGAGATGVGWELWLLGLDQYVGSGAPTTDDLERWRVTDEGKDYLTRATHDWGRAEIAHGEPAVSQHLKVLREAGFATVRVDGQRRLYAIDSRPLLEAVQWLDQFRAFWQHKFDALETEIARGKRERRSGKSAERKPSAARKSG